MSLLNKTQEEEYKKLFCDYKIPLDGDIYYSTPDKILGWLQQQVKVEPEVGVPSETLSCELNAIKHGLGAIDSEAKRQRKLAETFTDNEESRKFHTIKAYYFEDVLRIIEKNKEFYLKNLASKS